MQEYLPGYGFFRLAASARDEESMQGHERIAAVLPAARPGEYCQGVVIGRVSFRHRVPNTRKSGPVAKGVRL